LHGGQGEWPGQESVEHILVPPGSLQVSRERRKRTQPAAKIVEYEQENPGSNGERQEGVEIVSPWSPGPARPKEGVIEMMQPPQRECDGENGGPTRGHLPAVAKEHPPGPQSGKAEKEYRWTSGQQEMVQAVDRDVRPDRWE
jgi:hypothetical protein